MTKHPLNDEICDQIQDSIHPCDPENMRAAADWQLEKCDDELGNILNCLALAGKITEEERIQIYVLYKEAMRPTQGEQLQDEAVKKFIKNNSAALTKLADS